jgi:uncharacterized coiled-coil protein SlyX
MRTLSLGFLLIPLSLCALEPLSEAERLAVLEARVEAQDARIQVLENQLMVTKKSISDQQIVLEQKMDAVQAQAIENVIWQNPDLWTGLHLGMTMDAVLAILGEPDHRLASLNKRVDWVMTYQHPRVKSELKGVLKFYKDRLTSIEEPEF